MLSGSFEIQRRGKQSTPARLFFRATAQIKGNLLRELNCRRLACLEAICFQRRKIYIVRHKPFSPLG
ncbi:MAG: hypothetical protein LBL73_01755, partial [Synergistaceae bacterium]|nr:hypothetical protein [Synergistaceae bacterium]